MKDFTADNIEKDVVPLLDKIGFLVEGRAKELCPVDTGVLRASIQHTVLDDNSVVIGTNVPYAGYVEFMYPESSPRPGRETGQMPFLRPALFQSKNKINKLIKEHFGGA